jgi:hypothetical protein
MGKRTTAAFLTALLFLVVPPGRGEIQWLNGGTPQGGPPGSDNVVRDAPEAVAASEGPCADIVLCHLTTCTRLAGQYPADSVNYFYLNKHTSITYFAYFLMKPSTRIHTAVAEWFNPAGNRIARYEQEFRVGFTDRLLTVQNETYQWFLLSCTLGVGSPNPDVRQTGLPRDVGLYTVNLTVDGQPAGITFFYVKSQEPETPKGAAVTQSGSGASPGTSLPMSTPTSNSPLLPLPKR